MNKQLHKALAQCASKDQTRYHLTFVHADKNTKNVIATDGHRLFSSSLLYNENLAGKFFDANEFSKARYFEQTDNIRFPDITQLIPDITQYKKHIALDLTSNKINFKGRKAIKFHFDLDDLIVYFNDCFPQNKRNKIVSVNAKFLEALNGLDSFCYIKDQVSPILFTSKLIQENGIYRDLKQMEYFYMVMPMRI